MIASWLIFQMKVYRTKKRSDPISYFVIFDEERSSMLYVQRNVDPWTYFPLRDANKTVFLAKAFAPFKA